MERLRRRNRQRGFTLVEMIVAVVVAMIIFLGGAAALSAMMTVSTNSRLKQHATEVVTEAVEDARAMDYASLAMQTGTDLTSLAATSTPIASRLTGTGPAYEFDPDGTSGGTTSSEAIVALPAGAAIDPLRIADRNGAQYTVRTYVTVPEEGGTPTPLEYRRVAVKISWVQNGKTYERQSSTFVTDTRRGLPLPNFSVTGKQTGVAVSAGQTIALKLKLSNNGARDRWTFGATSTAGWTFAWYHDTDRNGSFDSAVDLPITDSDGAGGPDSGALETDQSELYFGVTTVPVTAIAGTVSVTFAATAVSNTTVSRSLTHTVSVTATGCSVCVYKTYWLRNGTPKKVLASNYSTTAAPANPNEATIQTDPPVLAPLYDFDSTDADTQGRRLQRTGAGNGETAVAKIIVWKYTYPVKTYEKAVNVGVMKVWARTSGGGNGTVTLTGYLYRPTGSGGPATVIASGSATKVFEGNGGTFAEFVIPLNVATTESVNAGRPLEFKLVADNITSTVDALVAYDTTTYPAYVSLPESLT